MKLTLPNNFLKKYWVFLCLCLALTLGGGWYGYSQWFSGDDSEVIEQTSRVEKGTITVSVTSSGQVDRNNAKAISTQVTGVVKKVFVKNDQLVKSGDKLVEIELDEESKQAYNQALSSYQSAKNAVSVAQNNMYSLQSSMLTKWDTYKELSESESYKDVNSDKRALPEFLVPQNDWLSAEAAYKNQQSVVEQAQTALYAASLNLKLTSPLLYAPISGRVSGISLMAGSVLDKNSNSETNQTQTIGTVLTEATPTLSLNLTEVDVTKVSLQDKAIILLDAFPEKSFTGKVISIDTTGTTDSGVTSYPAVIAFDTDVPEIFSQMSAQVSLLTDIKTDVLMIPLSAVQTQDGVSRVQVKKNGETVSVEVVLGLTSDTQAEVISGLEEGDEVVTSSRALSRTTTSTQTTSPFSSFGGSGMGGAVRIAR